jgi:hypothetical protein
MLSFFPDFKSYQNINDSLYYIYSPIWRKNIINKTDENIHYTNLKNLILKEGGIIKGIDIYELEKGNRTINLVKDLEVN